MLRRKRGKDKLHFGTLDYELEMFLQSRANLQFFSTNLLVVQLIYRIKNMFSFKLFNYYAVQKTA